MRVAAIIATLVLLVGQRTARAEPSDRTLVITGIAAAPVDYLLGTALHEGSHALAAKLVGADVQKVHLFPPGIDPATKTFRFGWTYVRGLKGRNSRVLFYIAPKITDSLLLGGFAALAFTNAWPDNKYGALALTVLGTGLWVDFSKDVVLFSKTNDVVKVFDLWCMKGWKQLPARLVYAAAVVGWGFVVAHGYRRLFDDDTATAAHTLPIAGFRF